MNVLIAGKNSYIGCHLGRYILEQEPHARVTYISVRDDSWRTMDLTGYDGVAFVAAVVHHKNFTDLEMYHRVNTVLPFEFAQKAKAEGVRRFLFLSSAAVYGQKKTLPKTNVITADTPLAADEPYGKSKLEAERLLQTLSDERFLVTLVRPINVYGRDCPGNYISMFMKIAKRLPVYPKAFLGAKQGFVHVRSLAKLCYMSLKADRGGIYHAQDSEMVSTYEILQSLSKAMGIKRPGLSCHTLLRLLSRVPPVIKLFGGVSYDPVMTSCPLGDYCTIECKEGMAGITGEPENIDFNGKM